MSKTQITRSQVKHIALLANIPINENQADQLADNFIDTLKVIDQLKNIDTQNVSPTHQVTGLTNVLREDEVDEERMFSQAEALANAKHTYQGYFEVEKILEK